MTLGMILLLWPMVSWLMDKRRNPKSGPCRQRAGPRCQTGSGDEALNQAINQTKEDDHEKSEYSTTSAGALCRSLAAAGPLAAPP